MCLKADRSGDNLQSDDEYVSTWYANIVIDTKNLCSIFKVIFDNENCNFTVKNYRKPQTLRPVTAYITFTSLPFLKLLEFTIYHKDNRNNIVVDLELNEILNIYDIDDIEIRKRVENLLIYLLKSSNLWTRIY